MPTLLRKTKTSANATSHVRDLFTSDNNSTTGSTPPSTSTQFTFLSSTRNPSFTRSILPSKNNTRTRGELGTKASSQTSSQLFVARFRRILAFRAFAFNLRPKSKRGRTESTDPQTPRSHILFAFENDPRSYNQPHFPEDLTPVATVETLDTESAPYPPPISFDQSRTFYHNSTPLNIRFNSSPAFVDDTELEVERDREPAYIREAHRHLHSSVIRATCDKMAFESAAPPVPYERLRQLTTEACDATFSSIKAYSHTYTESWNTAIINTILSALVHESTPSSAYGDDTSTPQPNFKFIVNSTIIQHAPVSSAAGEDVVKSAGRRGMHSASGAFWNNEKDGMWSFKYEAAEAKGLDVVVGIVWVWVG